MPRVFPSAADRFWANVLKSDGCWTWTASTVKGYGLFRDGAPIPAHRFSWKLHNGPIPEGMVVCHRCDNPPCVRPDHLFLGTHRDNALDMVAKHRQARGPTKANALSAELVAQVLALHVNGENLATIAKRCGIAKWTANRIVNGKHWSTKEQAR